MSIDEKGSKGGIALSKPLSKRQRREKLLRGRTPTRRLRIVAERALDSWIAEMALDITEAHELYASSPLEFSNALSKLKAKWTAVFAERGERLSKQWVEAVSVAQKASFQASVEKALGVDRALLLDSEGTRIASELSSKAASELITKIPSSLFEDVQQAVLKNYNGIGFSHEGSLTDEIQRLLGVSRGRARLIARDQTSKINIAITQARNEEVGIEEYIWRTVKDERVVGTPGGKYPKGNDMHNNHYKREGKRFKWNDPPPDGHPGFAINCRCVAEPVIDIEKLKFV